jgi:hypothetical protein
LPSFIETRELMSNDPHARAQLPVVRKNSILALEWPAVVTMA